MGLVRAILVLAFGLAVLPLAAWAEMRLMMVEQPGCSHCAAWRAEVGPEYPLTAEGKAAPLLRQDLRSALPDGLTIASPPIFTPTFILLVDGHETGRIEGYPGEDFFWPLLAQMIAKAG
jgi:hypothetical protein